MPIPRMTPEDLIEELREEALELGAELEHMPPDETIYGQAAQTLEEFAEALTRIAGGAPDGKGLAAEALRCQAPLRQIGTPDDVIRALARVPKSNR